MAYIKSGMNTPCPICARTFDDNCQATTDGEIVLCRTKANPQSKQPQPPDRINGFYFTGKFNNEGVMERAVYAKEKSTQSVNWEKPKRPDRDYTFAYGDKVRVRRIDKNGKKQIWQEYWIEDDRLSRHQKDGKWTAISEDKVSKGKATKEEREIYLDHVKVLEETIHLYRINETINIKAIQDGKKLYLVEGETTADLLLRMGIPATTAIGGAKKWGMYGGKFGNYKKDLEKLDSSNLILCPDCDNDGVAHCQQIKQEFPEARWLYANPDSGRWSNPATGKGYDLANWIEELRGEIKLSDSAIESLLEQSIEDGDRFADKPKQVTIQFSSDPESLPDLSRDDLAGLEQEDPRVYNDPRFEVTNKAATAEHHMFNNLFQKGKGRYAVIDAGFHRYLNSGVWEHIKDDEVKKMICDFSQFMYSVKTIGKGEEAYDERVYKYASDRNISSTIRFNRSALTVPIKYREKYEGLLNFRNCILNVKTGEILRHDKNYYLTSQIQSDYFPNRECPTEFMRFIYRTFGAEKTEFVRAVIRYYIDPTMPYGKFIHAIGKSGSGKGVLIRFLGYIHGDHFGSSSEFSSLNTAEGRYQLLTGKRYFAFPDVHGALPTMGAFYEAVDNGWLTFRPLYEPTAPTKRPNCRFIMASTKPIQFESSDTGWDRRCVPLQTIPREGEIDPGIEDRLKECAADVISWAMAMPRDEAFDYVFKTENKISGINDLKDKQAIASDSVKAFIDACLVPDDNETGDVSKQTLYGYYKAFCAVSGSRAKGYPAFCSAINDSLPQELHLSKTSRMVAGKRVDVPARFTKLGVANPNIFRVKKGLLDSSIEDMEARAEYECIATHLQEGGLEAFRSYGKKPIEIPQPPEPQKIHPEMIQEIPVPTPKNPVEVEDSVTKVNDFSENPDEIKSVETKKPVLPQKSVISKNQTSPTDDNPVNGNGNGHGKEVQPEDRWVSQEEIEEMMAAIPLPEGSIRLF